MANVRFGSKAVCRGLMSALPPKADIVKGCWNVRVVPKVDVGLGSNDLAFSQGDRAFQNITGNFVFPQECNAFSFVGVF